MKINWPAVLACIAFVLLGFTVGWLTGLSRAPAVNVLLSSMLTFAGLFVTYLFSQEQMASRWLSPTLLILFLPFLLLGTSLSANVRIYWEEHRMKLEYWYKKDLAQFHTDLEIYKYKQTELLNKQSESKPNEPDIVSTQKTIATP